MPSYTTGDIRNIVFVGHGGSGKTSLVDALLCASGTIKHKASVADGSSTSDFEKEEKEHGHSIYSSLLHADHLGKRINIIDTPGSPDLIGHAIAVVPAVETVAVVVNAQSGIEVVTRRMMEIARSRNIPRAIVINKIDQPDIDLEALVAQIQETFGHECLPINLPTGGGKAVVECLLNKSGESDVLSVPEAHTAILDQIVELDDTLMEQYLGGEEPNYDVLHAPFERAMDEAHVVPILFTDAPTAWESSSCWMQSPNISPRRRKEIRGRSSVSTARPARRDSRRRKSHSNTAMIRPSPCSPMSSRSRPIHTSASWRSSASTRENAPANRRYTSATTKNRSSSATSFTSREGSTAKQPKSSPATSAQWPRSKRFVPMTFYTMITRWIPCICSPLSFPTPMYGLAITPKARGDEQKLSVQLAKIAEEDPTFRWATDRQTHEVVINGLGELHLRLVLEKLANRGLHVDTKPPKIAYRETISATAEGHHRHKKQTGGAGQFGEVFLRIEPLERGKGFEFVNEVFGGTIPGQFIPAVEKGVRDLLEQGVVAGYPLQDIRVCVTDGKHHPVDSKEVAFRTAGKFAFKDAILKAHPVLLEPIVNMYVTVPEDKMGTITGDLSGKRGRIQGTDVLPGGMAQINAMAPLAEVMQYQSQLKSVTGGQGSFSMELSHYEPAPPQVQQQIASLYKPKAEEE